MSELVYLGVKIPLQLETDIKALANSTRYKNKTDVVVTALRLLTKQELPIITAQATEAEGE